MESTTSRKKKPRATTAPQQPYREIDELNGQAWEMRSRVTDRALELATEARKRSEEIGYESGFASATVTLAFIDILRAHFETARDGADRALEIFTRLNDLWGQSVALAVRGIVSGWVDEAGHDMDFYTRSLEASRESGHREIEVNALNGIANSIRGRGGLREALEYYSEALDTARAAGLRGAEANVMLGIGSTYYLLGELKKALEYLEPAVEIGTALEHRRMLALAYSAISLVYTANGNVATALRYELNSLRYHEKEKSLQHAGRSLLTIAYCYVNLGEYGGTLDALIRCLTIGEQLGDKHMQASSLVGIGNVYAAVGEHSMALDYFLKSLRVSQEINDFFGEANALLYLGHFHLQLEDVPKALVYYFKSRAMYRKSGIRLGERQALHALGRAYQRMEDYEEAEHFFGRSLRLAIDSDDKIGEIDSLTSLGGIMFALGRNDDAVRQLQQAFDEARGAGFLDSCRLAALELRRIYQRIGDEERSAEFDRDYQYYTQAIFNDEATRRVRDLIGTFEGSMAFREGKRLGLDDDDLEKINAAVARMARRARTAPASSTARLDDSPSIPTGPRVAAETSETIRITTFGTFRVHLDGRELRKGNWSRKRARDLFKLLLVNHRTAVTVDEIHDKLWGNDRTDRNIELLVMNAASHIRKAFELWPGVHPPAFSLTCVDGAYTLDLGASATIDFLRFKELIVSARRAQTAEDRSRYYADALGLYAGDFLQEDLFTEWTDYQRQIMRDAFLEGLEYLTREHLRTGRLEDAIECARRILHHDDTSETAYHVLLLALRQCGRTGEAQKIYDECRVIFRRELGVDPPEGLRAIVAG